MSALRFSRPGHITELVVLEPAHAHVQGHGGSSIGWFSGTTLASLPKTPQGRTHRDPPKPAGVQDRCGALMPLVNEPCGRSKGHKDCHRSRVVMDTDNEMRRTNRARAGLL